MLNVTLSLLIKEFVYNVAIFPTVMFASGMSALEVIWMVDTFATVIFASYDKSGTSARTDTYDLTSGFPTSFNGSWTFSLEDEDAMGCNTVAETRIIVTYSDSATGNPAFLMFVD